VYLLNTFLDLTSCQRCITNIHDVMLLLYIFQLTCSYINLLKALLDILRNKMYVMLCYVILFNAR